jgi:Ca2+-binding RTX toxin-like protein
MSNLSSVDVGYIALDDDGKQEIQQEQSGIITSTGMQAHLISDLGKLQGLEVLFVSSIFSFGNYTTNKLTDFVEKGGSLFLSTLNDGAYLDPLNHDHEPGAVDIVDDRGPLASGPGGTLNDASLDQPDIQSDALQAHSSYYRVDLIQDREIAFLLTEDDPAAGVAALVSDGRGYAIETTLPLSIAFWDKEDVSDQQRALLDTLSANALTYGAQLKAMTETSLTAGADVYAVSGAAEDVFAGDGADRVTGGAGADIFHAGAGDDQLAAGGGADIAWGDEGADGLDGGSGDDQLWGGADADRIKGQGGDDFLVGGTGADVLAGGAGNDTLLGGDDADKLNGGAGDDVLAGGTGRDVLAGGAGADRFMFMNEYPWYHIDQQEQVADFEVGQDKIDFTAFTNALSFVGRFDGQGAEIMLQDTAQGTTVLVDTDADGQADWTLEVDTTDSRHLSESDFSLFVA